MELNELKSLMAASIVSGKLIQGSSYGKIKDIDYSVITDAVKCSQRIWEEVLRQERE